MIHRLRSVVRGRLPRLIAALALLAAPAAIGLLALGHGEPAVLIVGLALLVVVLVGEETHRRTSRQLLRTLKAQQEKLTRLERLVTRAEWRSERDSERLADLLRSTDPADTLARIERDMASGRRRSGASNGGVSASRASERDLDLLLAHLLAPSSGEVK